MADVSRRDLLRIPPALFAAGALGAWALEARAQSMAAAPATGTARLSFNENPYGPGPAARAAIQAAIGDSWKYPFPEEMKLRAAIAEREGLTPRHVMITNGSSEILHIAAMLYGLESGELVVGTPTFEMAGEHVRAIGGSVREVPLDGELRFDLAALAAAVSPATRLVYVCNPNNPTGTVVPGAPLREFIATMRKDVAVFVDEAYLELASDMAESSAVSRVRAGDNLIVARTFSKLHGLAGLRIGYALARPDLIDRMAKLKIPLGTLGLAAANASYADLEFQAESRRNLAEGVAIATSALDALKLRHTATKANFVFFDTGQPLPGFLAAMKQRGFSLGRPFPPYDTWCRVSIGTVAQMQAFAAALKAHYAG